MDRIKERLMRNERPKIDLHMTYDSECDVFYIRLNERLSVNSVDVGENVIVGLDANGEIVEIEILDLHNQLKLAEATLEADLAEGAVEESVSTTA